MNRRDFIWNSAVIAAGLGLAGRLGAVGLPTGSRLCCPKSGPPARRLCAFRLSELTTLEWDHRLALTCLQGLVNRRQPRLYLINDHYDELWLEWLQERGDVDSVEWLEIGQVFERFLPEAGCKFIIDPEVPATVNVATMLAGIFGGLVTTPKTAYQYMVGVESAPSSGSRGLDLRTFRWKKDIAAYAWAFETHGSRLSTKAMALMDPNSIALRDYLVEFAIPVLWVSADEDAAKNPKAAPAEEFAFAQATMMAWPANIPSLGWPGNGTGPEVGLGEDRGVGLASRCAKFEICSGFDGYAAAPGNVSVHSGTAARLEQKSAPRVTLARGKTYIALIRSDGDGLNFQRQTYRKLFDEARLNPETPPMGWQIGPGAFDAQPDILDYYFTKARPQDYFLNAVTGAGYVHERDYGSNYPEEKRARIWDDYIELSSRYMGLIGSSCISTFSEMPPEVLRRIASMRGMKGVFAGYGAEETDPSAPRVTECGGVPVFRAANRSFPEMTNTPASRRKAEAFLLGEIRARSGAPDAQFMHVFLANWLTSVDMIVNVARELGEGYVFVRPDQLVALYGQRSGG